MKLAEEVLDAQLDQENMLESNYSDIRLDKSSGQPINSNVPTSNMV